MTYISSMSSPFRSVVETGSYIASASELFDDAQRDAIILELSANPMTGDVSGRGKRGGARVIYFVAPKDGPVYLLMAFAKNAQADLTPSAFSSEVAAGSREENALFQ